MNYDKDSLIASHLNLAQDIARREWRTATHILKQDDMLSLAYLGLVDAADRWVPYCEKNDYDPSAVQFFKVFASFRIRGSIRDHIRKEDWATRTLRSKSKKLRDAGQDEGLTIDELAKKTGYSINEINKINAKLAARPVSLESVINYNDRDTDHANTDSYQYLKDIKDTEGLAFSNSLLSVFVDTVKSLPREVQLVLVLHYYTKMDLKKISELLDCPESKISHFHSVGVLSVKEALTDAAIERD